MTSKERMMLAINREKPDRLPVTIHQWQQYHLDKYMSGISDIEANFECGLDASICVFETLPINSENWKISASQTKHDGYFVTHYTIKTPSGTLTTAEGTSASTTWVTEHLIKKPEDITLLRHRPILNLNKEKVIKTHNLLGDAGILRTFLCGKQGGCWQDACELFGVENLIFATYDDPDWVHEFLQILSQEKAKYIEKNLKGMPFDLVETGGGASSNTVISPQIHREFCLPYDKIQHKQLRSIGLKSVYHTCGGMTKIVDCISENGCDVSETLSPTGVGGDIGTISDAKLVYDTLHPHVGLIGGMDQFNILEKGSKKEIEKETQRLFEAFGKDGGYILSASDHFFEASKNNLKIFANAAKTFIY